MKLAAQIFVLSLGVGSSARDEVRPSLVLI